MQSFLGSLNYYNRFIEDFAIYVSVLYELRETEFFEINEGGIDGTAITKTIKESRDPATDEGRERYPKESSRS